MSGFEENEISKNANGGTELAKRRLANMLDPKLLQEFQIMCSRVRDLDYSKIRVFWAHDLAEDPESTKLRDQNYRDQFHKLVFISNWQMQRYHLFHGIPYDDKVIVLESGIDPAPREALKKPKDKIRLVYTSTPQRGLEILVPVFEKLAETNPDIHLDVFSSFKIYGWDEADKNFEPLYDRIRNHPQMTYHGFVPNEEVKEALNKSHIFAYPCIWPETSCRAMLEAMSAGLVCVHSDNSALPESSGSLNIMYRANFEDRASHANMFAGALNSAIQFVRDNKETEMIKFNKIYVDNRYDIKTIQSKWEHMLNDLLAKYPDAESRKKPEQVFIYRTI